MRSARMMANLSQYDLEKVSGVTTHVISALELGRRSMSTKMAMKLAPHLRCTPVYLLFGV